MDSSYSIAIFNSSNLDKILIDAWKKEIPKVVDPNKYIIQEFTPSDTSIFDRGNVALVILPGGESFKVLSDMRLVANKIGEAVNVHKAALLGSCAGAIVTSRKFKCYDFENVMNLAENCHLEKNGVYHNLLTFAPYSTPKKSKGFNTENCLAIEVNWTPAKEIQEWRTSNIYHVYGPGFLMSGIGQEYKPLAYFTKPGNYEAKEPFAATVLKESGETRHLYTSLHPELTQSFFDSQLFETVIDNESHYKNICEALNKSELDRQEMFNSFFRVLGIQMMS